jgi:hypothetical protein
VGILGLHDRAGQAGFLPGLNAFNCDYTQKIADALESLWAEPVIQRAFRHRDETIGPRHMEYFFDKMQTVMADGYTPTDQDILRARIRSNGIDPVNFSIIGSDISLYSKNSISSPISP